MCLPVSFYAKSHLDQEQLFFSFFLFFLPESSSLFPWVEEAGCLVMTTGIFPMSRKAQSPGKSIPTFPKHWYSSVGEWLWSNDHAKLSSVTNGGMFNVTYQRSEEAFFHLVSVLKREIPEFVTTKLLSFISQLLQNTWMIEWRGYTSVFSCFPAICGTHGLLQYGPVCCNSNGEKNKWLLLIISSWKCKCS